MQQKLFIMAKISPKTEFFDRAKAALLDIVAATLKEQGCRQFIVHEAEQALFLYEEWDNQAALDKHYAMPYIVPVFESYQEWLAEPVEINKMFKLG